MYWANFGTRKLMFRLPRGTLDPVAARPFGRTDAFSVIETGSHVILSFLADRDPDGWEDEEPEGELADMARVRSELAAGDLRLVYLGWLLALQTDFSEAAAFTGLGGNLEDGVVMPGVGIRPLSWERAVQPSAHTRRPCPSALE